MSPLAKTDALAMASAPPQQNGKAGQNRFRLVPIDGNTVPSPRHYVVKDLIYERSTFLVYGASQAGKSFLAIDLLLSVAAGIPWMGHNTEPGLAVYVASEGRDGVHARVAGWKAAHPGKEEATVFRPQQADFNLLDAGHVDELIAEISSHHANGNIRPKLVIIDTLSSAIPGADENNQAPMSTVMMNLRRIAEHTGAAVGVVHHVSKASPREPRGNNVLFSGVDTSLLVSGSSGGRRIEVVKQRDGATGKKITFDLRPQQVEYTDEAIGETCVATISSPPVSTTNPSKERHQNSSTALLMLMQTSELFKNAYAVRSNGDDPEIDMDGLKRKAHGYLYTDAPSLDAKRKRLDRDLKHLENNGSIRREGRKVFLFAEAPLTGQPDGQGTPL